MEITILDPEPPMPPNAVEVAPWSEDEHGLFRWYREAEHLGIYVLGYQNWDGTERGRTVFLSCGGDCGRELANATEARAYAQAVLDAWARV